MNQVFPFNPPMAQGGLRRVPPGKRRLVPPPLVVGSNWILANGTWNNSGVWDNTATWNNGA